MHGQQNIKIHEPWLLLLLAPKIQAILEKDGKINHINVDPSEP